MGKNRSGGAAASAGRIRTSPAIVARTFEPTNYDNEDEAIRNTYLSVLEPGYANQAAMFGSTDSRKYTLMYEESSFATNNWLRGKGQISTKVKQIVDNIDRFMQPIEEAVTVYRGGILPGLNSMMKDGTLLGAVIDDKAFLSTTLNRNLAKEFRQRAIDEGKFNGSDPKDSTMIRIVIPKGKNVVFPHPNGQFSLQREIIVERNSRLRVTGARIVDGQLEVEAEVIL